MALAIVFAGVFGHALEMAFGRPLLKLTPVLVGPSGAVALAVPTAFVVLLGLYVPAPVSEAVQQVVALFGGGGL